MKTNREVCEDEDRKARERAKEHMRMQGEDFQSRQERPARGFHRMPAHKWYWAVWQRGADARQGVPWPLQPRNRVSRVVPPRRGKPPGDLRDHGRTGDGTAARCLWVRAGKANLHGWACEASLPPRTLRPRWFAWDSRFWDQTAQG